MRQTKRLKKLSLLCLAIILANFLWSWNSGEFVFFGDIFGMFLFLLLIVCAAWTIKYLKETPKSIEDFIPLFLIVIYLFYLFSGGQNKLNYIVYRNMRNDVIEMVENHQLYVDEDKSFVALPQKYRKCSSGGDVLIYQDEEYVVGCWVKRGFLDNGFKMFAYTSANGSSDVEQMIAACVWSGYEIHSEQIEKGWYYIYATDKNDY